MLRKENSPVKAFSTVIFIFPKLNDPANSAIGSWFYIQNNYYYWIFSLPKNWSIFSGALQQVFMGFCESTPSPGMCEWTKNSHDAFVIAPWYWNVVKRLCPVVGALCCWHVKICYWSCINHRASVPLGLLLWVGLGVLMEWTFSRDMAVNICEW